MRKPLAAFLIGLIICIPLMSRAFAAEGDAFVRVGLFYGSSALPGANLQNNVGLGYRFGYFDNSRAFVQLGYADKKMISVVKNRNVYYNGSNYTDTVSDIAVGAYSIELPETYASGEEAQIAADVLRANGQMAFVAYTSGVFTIRLNSYTSSGDAKNAAQGLGGTAVTGSVYCVSVVETGTNDILFQFDQNDNRGLGIMPSLGEVERPITWFKLYLYAGGFEYRRMDGNDVTVSNIVSMQDYAKSVVTWEMGAGWPIEALKAQALCAKSYAYSNMNKHGSSGFDVCNDTHCQAYHGTKLETANSTAAVDQTDGLYLLYDGKVCGAFYHSSNGGSTENSENVWYEAVPYLRAVKDTYEDLDTSYNGRWQYTLTNSMITEILRSKDYANSGIVSMTAQYTAAGNVYSLKMIDSKGTPFVFTKDKAKTILNSKTFNISIWSQHFTVNSGQTLSLIGANGTVTRSDLENITILGAEGKTSKASATTSIMSAGKLIGSVPQVSGNDTYIINGTGWGHNVGMSQNGAKAMANLGFTFEDILKFYFTGVYVGTLQ